MRKHKPMVFDSLDRPTIWNFRDLTGQRFCLLLVQGFAGIKRKQSYWNCVCDCGGTSTLNTNTLTSGKTRSCGCLQSQITVERNKASTVHGESYSLEYRTWNTMKMRCSNPKNIKYDLYGGRGIKVCDRWANSFEAFLADMGRRPTPRHTIDRIDGNKGYEPGNCRWATYLEQRHNRRPGVQQ